MGKITIEYTELKIDPATMYVAESYPGDGVYKVNDASGTPNIMIPEGTVVWNIPFMALANNTVEPDVVEKPSSSVSEEFSLKLLALALNKEKYADLKQEATLVKKKK